jgi:tRNA modification GTPase
MIIKSEKDTIAAIGTKAGESAIGIVRLSGSKSVKIAGKIFRSEWGKKIYDMETYSMAFGQAIDERGCTVDQVILTIMKAPKSYTREDVIEINSHGGIATTEKILSLCIHYGARLAEPGEFTKRAFLNGRIDLTQAEAVIDIIRAKTEQAARIAAKSLKGGLKEKIEKIRKKIVEVIIELEASIDFIEEDLETTPYPLLAESVENIFKEIKILIEDEKKAEIVKNGVRVSIIGKPNVGKSSLLNAIAKKEKAIVTHIPGTTRDAVEEILYIEGIPLIIIDTAGIRKTRDYIEKIGVERSIDYIAKSDLIIAVFDGSQKLQKEDLEIINMVSSKTAIACLNKSDLGQGLSDSEFLSEKTFRAAIKISAKNGTGIDKLEAEIKKIILGSYDIDVNNMVLINQRHKKLLSDAASMVKNAKKAMEAKMSEEFPASDLRSAYEIMGEITGETPNEDILDGIFSKFCIGK